MKALTLVIASIFIQLTNAADLQSPSGSYLLATHTDGGSIDVSKATIDKHDDRPPSVSFSFLGVDWKGSIPLRTITSRITAPGSTEPNRYLVFDGVLTAEEGARTVAISGRVDEHGVLRGKLVFIIGIGVPPGGTQEASAGTGTFVMRPDQAEQGSGGQPATRPESK
jgi:hypothetical protein